jgi:putative hemolysin
MMIPATTAPSALSREVEALPSSQQLAAGAGCTVHWASSAQIPELLEEIGRQREITFRLAGEGTGKEVDLDRFDERYLHLFVWHRRDLEVVGAYRLGLTGDLDAGDARGLYSHTLFRFDSALLNHLGPAIELGRSFVRTRYQRSSCGLPMLWRGIGAFVARHPEYRRLLGPVSISASYRPLSRHLIVSFLRKNVADRQVGRLVRARRPVRGSLFMTANVVRIRRKLTTLEDLDAAVRRIEPSGIGLPVLIRKYLGLGGRFLRFNVDPDFADVIDGLILVDLARTDPAILRRFMGAEGAHRFVSEHADNAQAL